MKDLHELFFLKFVILSVEPPSQQPNETRTAPVVPKLDLPSELPPPPARVSPREQTLSIMAEKKRQKWIREKGIFSKTFVSFDYFEYPS